MTKKQPPKWIDQLLEWYCSGHYLEEVQGDLHEWFHRRARRVGYRRARWVYLFDVIAYLRLFRIKKLNEMENNNNRLFINYTKMAFRQYKRNFGYASLNLLGLTVGLLSTILIALYILDELNYDRFHDNHENIYRLVREYPDTGLKINSTPSPWKPNMERAFPQILAHTRMGQDLVLINSEGSNFLESNFYWADDNFFEVFSFEVLAGDRTTMLDEPNALVLTRSMAMRYFGNVDVLGETVKMKVYDGDQRFNLKITGVVEDLPNNSHIQFDMLGSMVTTKEMYARFEQVWGLNWMQAYVVLPENVDLESMQEAMPAFFEEAQGEGASRNNNIIFQPLTEVRLYSEDIQSRSPKGNLNYLYLFGFVAVLVLLAASFNYVNLTTAKSTRRGKEVSMRKIFGARSGQVAGQFYLECSLSLLAAFILAIGMTSLVLPAFNDLAGKSFVILDLFQWQIGLVMFGVFGLLLLLSGFYPAMIMNRFRPVDVLKGNLLGAGGDSAMIRKTLVLIQCAIAAFFISSTVIVVSQMRYFNSYDMGFKADQLINIPVDDRGMQDKLMLIKDRMANIPGVNSITASGEGLPSAMNNKWNFKWPGISEDQRLAINIVAVDYDYLATLETDMVLGRNFSKEMPSDSGAVIMLNESAYALTGWKDLEGKTALLDGNPSRVIGVVQDFHYNSLHSSVAPCAYALIPPGNRSSPDNLILRIEPASLTNAINEVDKIWREYSEQPLDFSFVDQAFARLYGDEQRFMTVVISFAGIGTLLAVLGLVSLIAFVAERKSKELSIRKVLGASRLQILKMVAGQFGQIFLLSLVVALPLSRWAMESWLEGFANRVPLGWEVFVFSGGVALVVTLISISFQAIRVAVANPTRYLSDH